VFISFPTQGLCSQVPLQVYTILSAEDTGKATAALKSIGTTQVMHFTTSGSTAARHYLSTPQDKPQSCGTLQS